MPALGNSTGDAFGNAVADANYSPDMEVAEFLQTRLNEAAERVTFHSQEVERWQRIARAAAAGLGEIQAQSPVGATTPEDFLHPSPQRDPLA